jgi:MarR family transcriptional regulator, lower aerobic nicotinate degradation pathway regulator
MTALRRIGGQPTWLLSRANLRAQQILHDAFAREGVSGYHFRLLAALDEFGAASQADLGRRTGIDRSDIVAAVNILVAGRLISREPDPDDRRRNVIAITTRGAKTLERLDAVLAAVQDAVLEPLSDRERATLARLLAKLG